MVCGRRLPVTSFFVCCWVVVLWLVFVLCFGCASFCFAVVAFVAGVCFFCVAGWLRVVGFAGFLLLLGFVLWRLLFAARVVDDGVCRLLVRWVCYFSGLSRLACFCVFRTSTFSPLLPYFCVVRRLWLLAYCCLLPAPVCFLPPVFWRSLPC